jgi:PAS domain S-box-containing protein
VATVALFVIAVFVVVVPTLEQSIFDRKMELTRGLTNAALGTLGELHAMEAAGLLSREQAQSTGMRSIRAMRYGPEMKDYLWISDDQGQMLMHPYREDLVGGDISNMTDHRGWPLPQAFAEAARSPDGGFTEYEWQWKDESGRVATKISYVRSFEPWGWIVGTGVYVEDVAADVGKVLGRLLGSSLAILTLVLVLSLFIIHHGLQSERRRQRAELLLRESNQWLAAVIESSPLAMFVTDAGGCISTWNRAAVNLLGWTLEEARARCGPAESDAECCPMADLLRGVLRGRGDAMAELLVARRDGAPLELKVSVAALRDSAGRIVAAVGVAQDITLARQNAAAERAKVERMERQQTALVRIATDEAVAAGDVIRAARSINAIAAETMGVARLSAWMFSDDRTALRCIDLFERAGRTHSAGAVLRAADIPSYVKALDADRVVDSQDVRADPRTAELAREYLSANGVTALLGAPIRVAGDVVGAVCAGHTAGPRAWTMDEITFVGAVADQLAQAVVNGRRRQAENELKQRVTEVSEAKRRLEVLVHNMAGREERMVELKGEVNQLRVALGQEPKYSAPRETEELRRRSTAP